MAAPICTLHHHIGPESSFERGLGVASTRAAFEAQVARVSRDFDVIDLETLINGKLPKKPLLITFDDAFASVHDMAREVLAPAGLPSVFFVNPGLVGVPDLSLDSAIAYAANEHGVGELCRAIDVPERENIADLVVGDMARLGAVAREAVKARIIEAFGPLDLGPRAPLLTRNELAALADYGVEVGNHTTSHVHCRALNAAEIESEIVASKAMLEEMTQKKIRSFSVPYGHETDLPATVLKALRETGHSAIFLVHARANTHRPAPDIWYRTSLHDETPAQLNLHLGVKPRLRSLRHRMGF